MVIRLSLGNLSRKITCHLNPAVVRAPRTLRQVQIQGGTRSSAQVYWLYIEHEIRDSDTVDVPVSAFECRITAGFRCHGSVAAISAASFLKAVKAGPTAWTSRRTGARLTKDFFLITCNSATLPPVWSRPWLRCHQDRIWADSCSRRPYWPEP